jgi:antitoxin VapB
MRINSSTNTSTALRFDGWPISRGQARAVRRISTEMAYTYVYAMARRANMQRKAKVFMNNRSQAVRLPKEFRFRTQEVFIRKEGSEVVLSPRPFDWTSYLAEGPVASADFMEGIEDLPVQEREP